MTASASQIRPVRQALLSVSDKAGLVDFARGLVRHGVALVSTGGTRAALEAAGLPVRDVSEITGFPEMLGGRVKTLHPAVHGGILAVRSEPAHRVALDDAGIQPIDLVVVNLYPFEKALSRGLPYAAQIEEIDIGGVALLRAAAKNHADVTVVADPDDYAAVLDEIEKLGGGTSFETRRRLALKAFARTAAYDAAIGGWLARESGEAAPPVHVVAGRLKQTLRYGENPHQRAAFHVTGDNRPGVATARQVQGKELSYNNINDTDAAYELVGEFDPKVSAAVVIVKHANPCGVAEADDLADAWRRALATDPVSPYGGIVAVNRILDAGAAEEIAKIFTEVVIAPDATDEAKEIFARKKNLRLLLAGGVPDPRAAGETLRTVSGGFLVQSRDAVAAGDLDLKVVTRRAPSAEERADLIFAFRVAKHVKSNAIVYAKGRATVGIGAGQMSRVDSSRIAAMKAEDAAQAAGREPATKGSVVASDAFFPFADGLLVAAEAGATAVIQPGGSIRDDEVIKAADEAGLAMIFTGVRHFRH